MRHFLFFLLVLLIPALAPATLTPPKILITYGIVEIVPSLPQYYAEMGTDFLSVTVAGNKSYVFHIKNIGGSDLTVNKAATALSGANSADFSFSYHAGANVLPPGGQLDLSLTFVPSQLGDRIATLTIPSDDPDFPNFQVNVTGKGVAGTVSQPDLALEFIPGLCTETSSTKNGKRRVKVAGLIIPQNNIPAEHVAAILSTQFSTDSTGVFGMSVTAKVFSTVKGIDGLVTKPKKFKLRYDIPEGTSQPVFVAEVSVGGPVPDRLFEDNKKFVPLTVIAK